MNMQTETITKRWGNSMAIVLPRKFVVEHNIKEQEILVLEIKKRQLGAQLMGLLKEWHRKPQTVKDDARAGWR